MSVGLCIELGTMTLSIILCRKWLNMAEQIEISSLDLRYEAYRLRSPGAEKTLLASILENGIRDPFQGVDTDGCRILLDGFKRYRCALRLSIGIVPYWSLGDDEASGLIELLRASNARGLSILEQARLIDELKTVHQMSTAEIAGLLEKSKAVGQCSGWHDQGDGRGCIQRAI